MSLARQSALTLAFAGVVACAFTTGEVRRNSERARSTAARSKRSSVTARRREESVQDVPIAITAFGGEELEHRGIEAIQNLNAAAPNVSIQGGGANAEYQGSFVVRGIPGVATYIDGIWQSTTDGLFTLEVVDVDRIEVLRGPQGTLFGKNTVGGAIQYITRPPAERSRRARALRSARSIGGTFKRRWTRRSPRSCAPRSLARIMRRDGFVSSLAIDRDYGDVHDQLLRADVLWQPRNAWLRAIAGHRGGRAGPPVFCAASSTPCSTPPREETRTRARRHSSMPASLTRTPRMRPGGREGLSANTKHGSTG